MADNQDWLLSATATELIIEDMAKPERDLYRKTHETIQQITKGLDGSFTFNIYCRCDYGAC